MPTPKIMTDLGYDTFPIKPLAKYPPLVRGWPYLATTDWAATGWDVRCPEDSNVGVHCRGLLVIDVDVHKGGDKSFAQLREHGITIGQPLDLNTLMVETPSGGLHVYFRLPQGIESVRNSVEVLGKGLDVRSTNGYVLAPTSVVRMPDGKLKSYRISDLLAKVSPVTARDQIPVAPMWLVERCGEVVVVQHEVVSVLPCSEEDMSRALEWLETAPRSVRGQGGDQTAYAVACALRDRGLSYEQCCYAMRSKHWDHGCGWRDGWLEQKPIRSAYRYAQNSEGGSAVALDTDFATPEDMPDVPAPAPSKRRRVQRLNEFASPGRAHDYIIKGLIDRGTQVQLYGEPGEGKTFIALSMSYHIAAGLPWCGYKVKQMPVLYLAFEAHGGLAARGQALVNHYGDDDVPLYRCDAAGLNLRTSEGRRELAGLITDLPELPGLVVIDTFHLALMGGDENSSQDVGALMTSIGQLVAKGLTVMMIHHPGKNKQGGPRGSSAIHATLDTEFQVRAGGIYTTKQRDLELQPPIGFRLEPVRVGTDEDGEPISSCVMVPASVSEALGLPPLKGMAERVFLALCELAPDNAPVSQQDLHDHCQLAGMEIPKRRNWLYDVLVQLKQKGYISVDNDRMITRAIVA